MAERQAQASTGTAQDAWQQHDQVPRAGGREETEGRHT